jgi:hypothetical protein
MYFVFAFIGLVIVAILLIGLATGRFGGTLRRTQAVQDDLESPRTPTLEYDVPTGQDPAVVLAALQQAGVTATNDSTTEGQRVLIACPEGLDRQRARARAAIGSANVTTQSDGVPMQVDVRFADEV